MSNCQPVNKKSQFAFSENDDTIHQCQPNLNWKLYYKTRINLCFCLVQSAAWKIYSYVIILSIILVLLCDLVVIYSHSIYLYAMAVTGRKGQPNMLTAAVVLI